MARQLMKWTRIAAAAGAVAISAPAAHAVEAVTTVRINFPEVLILYSYENIELNVLENALTSRLGVSGNCVDASSYCVQVSDPAPIDWSDFNNPVDAQIAAAPLSALGSVNVNILNAWGVRSIAGGPLSALVDGPASLQSTDDPGVTLPVSNDGTDNNTPGRGLGSLSTNNRSGNIRFSLDINDLELAGEYSGDFVITVTST